MKWEKKILTVKKEWGILKYILFLIEGRDYTKETYSFGFVLFIIVWKFLQNL